MTEIQLAQERFGLGDDAEVDSCYKAGRDGFWLQRFLEKRGVRILVVDSASLEVSRRFRRVTPAQAGGARETDRMDSGRRLGMLMRFPPGERKGWSVVHVPSVRAEAERHSHREMMALKKERTRHRNRIYGLLSSQGVMLEVDATFMETTETVRLWNDSPVPGICGWAWKGSTRDGVVAAADWSIGKGTELNTLGAGIRIPCAHLSLLMSGFE